MPLPVAPNIRDLIISWAYQGTLADEIASRLHAEYGVQVAPRTVNNVLHRYRAELADVSKGIIRRELQKHLAACVAVFVETCNRAADLERRARARARIDVELLAQRQQMHAAERLLHFAGVDQPDKIEMAATAALPAEENIAGVRAALYARVEQVIANMKAKANGSNGSNGTNGTGNGAN
jgi:hypothetical protein